MNKKNKKSRQLMTKALYSFVILTFLLQSAGISFTGKAYASDESTSESAQSSEKKDDSDSSDKKEKKESDSKIDEKANTSKEDDDLEEKAVSKIVEKEDGEDEDANESITSDKTDSQDDEEEQEIEDADVQEQQAEKITEVEEKSITDSKGATLSDKKDDSDDSDDKEDKKDEDEDKKDTDDEKTPNTGENKIIPVVSQNDNVLSNCIEPDTDVETKTENGGIIPEGDFSLQDDQIATVGSLLEIIDGFLTSQEGINSLFEEKGEQEEASGSSEEIIIETWSLEDRRATTNLPVKIDETYTYPHNYQVSIKFTKLPENPGTITIEEIDLTDEQTSILQALSDKAYEITSTMENGTFEYDLMLPKNGESEMPQIIYTEKSADEIDDLRLDEFQAVDDNRTNVDGDSIKADGIDHFTVFVVVEGSVFEDDNTIGLFVWNNPIRARTSNDAYARTTLANSTGRTHYLKVTGYNPSVPAGSVIEGIEVKIERHQSCAVAPCTSVVRDNSVRMVKAGNIVGADKAKTALNWPADDTVATYGGPNDLWGATWTPAQINNINTGVVLSVDRNNSGDRDVYVDHIEMTVYYTPAYTITASSGTGGSINPSGSVKVVEGNNQKFEITPDSGYIVDDVLADNISQGRKNSYTFSNVTSDHEISATFEGGWKQPSDFSDNNNVDTPGQAYSSNDSYATFNSGADRVDYRSFDLGISAGTIIEGIEVALEGVRPASGTRRFEVSLSWNDGNDYTTEKTAYGWSDTERTAVVGGPNALWGRDWQYLDFRNARFRVRIQSTTGNDPIRLDQVQTRVHYHMDTTPPVISLNGDNPMTVEVGDSYSEPGATWTDNGDGSGTVTDISGTVDTNTVGDYTVAYSYIDAAGNNTTEYRTVSVVDTTIPVISLLGDDPVTVEVGDSYTDAGAEASDNYDGDISASITTDNPVDTNVVGDYMVTYNVTDSSNNAADEVTRKVNVVDTTNPVITLLGSNPVLINVGGSYNDEGATAEDNYDGDITANIVTDNPVDTNTVGEYTVRYNVTDANGNAADEVTRTVKVVRKASSSSDDDDDDDDENNNKNKLLISGNIFGDGGIGSKILDEIDKNVKINPAQAREQKTISIDKNAPGWSTSIWWSWLIVVVFIAAAIYFIRMWMISG